MADGIKTTIIAVAGVTSVILIFFIFRFIIGGLTKSNIKSVYSNQENLTSFQNHIYNSFSSSFNNEADYFDTYNVVDNYKDFQNVNLYNNPFDYRSFAVDSNGDLYKNLANTFTK